jgi:hypothetical protein
MIYWTFMDFYEQGQNQVQAWLDSLPPSQQKAVKSKLNQMINSLERLAELKPPQVKPLKGYEGILEMRFMAAKVQCRPLMARGPDSKQVTILIGAKEIGNKFVPEWAPDEATKRRLLIQEKGRTQRHDFS